LPNSISPINKFKYYFEVFRLTFLILNLSLLILPGHVFAQVKSPGELMQRADSLCSERNYEGAVSGYKDYLEAIGKISNDQKSEIADLYGTIAFCYYKLDNYTEAVNWFMKSLELRKELGKPEEIANTLNNIGLNHKKLGNYNTAIDYYMQTVRIDEELGNRNNIVKTYNNIGMIYRQLGQYDQAIEFFEKSYRIKKELNDLAGMSISLNNMGLVYSEWKKYDQALLNFRESLNIEASLENNNEMGIRINNIGMVYYYMNEHDSAMVYFERALKIQKEQNDQDQIALAYNNMGRVYQSRKQYTKAIFYQSSALDIFNDLGMDGEKSTVLANLSDCYRQLGNKAIAIQMLDSSTMLATRLNLRRQLQKNYEYFSEIYEESGDYKRSLEYYKKYTFLKDSVFNKETLSQLSEFQIKYEKEKDQARILALEKENLQKTNQRNAYMFTGLGIIVIGLFTTVYFRQKAVHEKIISDQKIRQLEEEKKFMAAKMLVEGQELERKRIATELHDGLGVLLSATKMQFSVIKDKSPENSELIQKALRMLEQATGDVRKISHNMMPGLLTKLGFYEAVEDLIDRIDETEGFKAVCSISGSQERLTENREIMLYRIIQEMVNNTIRHAQAKNIVLQISLTNGLMELIYSDDGKGFDFKEKLETKSIGLKSITSRVNFLNGTINIDSAPGKGARYLLKIPVNII
jgi:two-component system NarL family sensor kinase